jgi:YVTN family beta-propeller protein
MRSARGLTVSAARRKWMMLRPAVRWYFSWLLSSWPDKYCVAAERHKIKSSSRPRRIIMSLLLLALLFLATNSSQAANPAPLPDMPAILDSGTSMLPTVPGNLSPAVRNYPARIYVPNSESNSVTVIDPTTYRLLDEFHVGRLPQHVTPSYDLRTLWVLNDKGNSLTRIDPATAKPKSTIRVSDPYNMYYTPDGRYAIVVAEARKRLNFLDAATMKLTHLLKVPCKGVDHIDFSAYSRYLIACCEFSGTPSK